MAYLKALFLAIVEGATEFIPVSSTGHMIIVDEYVQLSTHKEFSDAFKIIIQLPAVLAVVAYFWSEIWPFRRNAEERNARFVLWAKIVTAFLPAAVFGVLLNDFIEERLFNPVVVALALVLGGIILIVLERRTMPTKILTVYDLAFTTALYIGLFQCLAMIPGTSRSAATIIGALLLGASRPAAAEFSFLLAIPTMLGATVFKIGDVGADFTTEEWGQIAVGSLAAFLVAYSVVAMFMNYIQRRDFRPFGYYRVALGILVLIHYAWTHPRLMSGG